MAAEALPPSSEKLLQPEQLEQGADLQELLLRACQDGQVPTVQHLLKQDLAAIYKADAQRLAEQLFIVCAENGSLECLRLLIRKFRNLLNINAVDEDGTPCLQLAVLGQHIEMVEYLLKCGTDVNARDADKHTALHWAIVCQHHDIMTLLLVNGADIDLQDNHGATALHYAAHMCGKAERSGEDTALLLLQHLLYVKASASCEDSDGRSSLLWAANAGSSKACMMLVAGGAPVDQVDRNGLSAQHCAATRGHASVLVTLVQDCHASVNLCDGHGCPALFYAINHCHLDCVQALLRLGSSTDCRDEKGRSAAHYSAEFGNLDIVKELLSAGCDFWLPSNGGELPIHAAIRRSNRDVSAFLLAQDAKINKATLTGCLHLAAGVNDKETVCEVLRHGGNINAVAKYKNTYMTALDVAHRKGHHECYKYIRFNGGRHAKGLVNASARRIQTAFRAKANLSARSGIKSGDTGETCDISKTPAIADDSREPAASGIAGGSVPDAEGSSSSGLPSVAVAAEASTDNVTSQETELDEARQLQKIHTDEGLDHTDNQDQNEPSDILSANELAGSIQNFDKTCLPADIIRSSDPVENSEIEQNQRSEVGEASTPSDCHNVTLVPDREPTPESGPGDDTSESTMQSQLAIQHKKEPTPGEIREQGDSTQTINADADQSSLSETFEANDQAAALRDSSDANGLLDADTSVGVAEQPSQSLPDEFTSADEVITPDGSSDHPEPVNTLSGVQDNDGGYTKEEDVPHEQESSQGAHRLDGHDSQGRPSSRSQHDELKNDEQEASSETLDAEPISQSKSTVSDDSIQVSYRGAASLVAGNSADQLAPQPPGSPRTVAFGYRRTRPRTSSSSSSTSTASSTQSHNVTSEGRSVTLAAFDHQKSPSIMPEPCANAAIHGRAHDYQPPANQRPRTAAPSIQQARLSTSIRMKKEIQGSVKQYEAKRRIATAYRELLRSRHRSPVFSVITILPSMPSTVHYDSNLEFPAIVTHKDRTKKIKSVRQN